jgi:hypothetical protein
MFCLREPWENMSNVECLTRRVALRRVVFLLTPLALL